jgi:hypothetical protein
VTAIADAMESGDLSLCRGRIAQTLRWLALSIDCPKDQLVAWRLTFLADPVPVVTPTRAGSGGFDLNASMLDPAQVTASLGMSRDMDLMSKAWRAARQ